MREAAASYPPRLAFMFSCSLVRRLLRLGHTEEALIEAARIGLGPELPDALPKYAAIPRSRDLCMATVI